MVKTASKYLQLLIPIFNTKRTKEILQVNPTIASERPEPEEVTISVFDYTTDFIEEYNFKDVQAALHYKGNSRNTWINIDGIRKKEVEVIAAHYGIHYLIVEDILSIAQRPKMDEIEGIMFCVLNMLYFNEQRTAVEQEQISIALGKDFVISFQEDPKRDVLDTIREKLKIPSSKLRQSGPDYLCYAMLDVIVDHYFLVLEKLGDRIELLEEEIIRYSNTRSLARINSLRKELIVLKRNILPVRDLINGFVKNDIGILEDKTLKYFKDVYDHIVQATDLVENYRDMMINLQDLYMSRVNLKLNEVMKVMAIVTCLLAPATVIGGVFGMNFDIIPYAHQNWGFYLAVGVMLVIPLLMLWIFKRRGWF